MPINHTTITPSFQLTMELSRLAQIAAGAKVIGHQHLESQAREVYNNLVSQYNSQLPSDKPKGFWAQFKDNLTFRDLDTTVATRLPSLDSSTEYQTFCDIFKKMDLRTAVDTLNKIINRQL